ncbi:TatD family hydrolase [Psychrobium sp. MM17-31]|uniref:TatD family hydrolase n=1 Tax=Psychrobium sp. MM17-31 TaxID=2917758 RepID=UPI001EF5F383|nr:TatD family hydrolase [Psychrobium sp. MM17-31]
MKEEHYFIDTHCHLDFDRIGDLNDVLSQSNAENVRQFVVPSVNADNWQRVLELSKVHTAIYAALGVHPYFLSDDNQLNELGKLATAQRDNIVAIGEIGLDGALDISLETQLSVLKPQLKLAKELALPVICHGHKAYDALLKQLRIYQLPRGGVIHAFAGSLQQATAFIDLGFYIGVGGSITYPRGHKLRSVIEQLPHDRLLLETDSPDMPLHGFQGQVNFPHRIPLIAQILADTLDMSVTQVAYLTSKNAKSLFNLPNADSPQS